MNTSIRADAVVGATPFGGSFAPSAHPRSLSHDSFELVAASPQDHAAIYRLLVAVFQGPSIAEFQAQVEAPRYDPCDRLLVRRGSEIAAHAQMVLRTLRMGSLELPTMDVRFLATLPEYRSHGLGSMLLDGAMEEMRRAGVLVGTIRAKHPAFFRQHGWFPCNRFSYSVASPRSLLAAMEAPVHPTPFLRPREAPRYSVQVWRRNELEGLASLFDAALEGTYGDVCRLDSDWKWLISREAYDRLYIVCEDSATVPSSRHGLPAPMRHIVGYGVVRDSRLLEFRAAARDAWNITRAVIARVCQDALEGGRNLVEIHAAPEHPVHDRVIEAGGKHIASESSGNRILMACISRPLEFLTWLKPELRSRAQRGGIPPHQELGIHTPKWQARIQVGTRSLTVTGQRSEKTWIELDNATAGQLMLGHISPHEAQVEGLLKASDPAALELAATLFPELPFWRPTWEDVTA